MAAVPPRPPMSVRFEVDSFEQVPAGPGTVLLRIAGRWAGPRRERLPTPLLLVDDGRRTHRLSPLPSPDDSAPLAGPDAPLWRAAFSAPVDLVRGARVAFALDAGRGGIADLPRPDERGQPAPDPAASPASAPATPQPASPAAPAAAPSTPPRVLRRSRREAPAGPDARTLAREAETLRAALAAERAAREQAERQAAEAHALAQRAAADAQHAMELAARAEAARMGAVDALTDERLRTSERAVAEEERERERRAEVADAADRAQRATVVAHEAQRALQEREAELDAARQQAQTAAGATAVAESRIAELEQALADAEERAAELVAAVARADRAEQEHGHERLGRQAADRRAEQAEQRIRALEQQVGERDARVAALEAELRATQRRFEDARRAAGPASPAAPGDALSPMTASAVPAADLLATIRRERVAALALFGLAGACGTALLAGGAVQLLP